MGARAASARRDRSYGARPHESVHVEPREETSRPGRIYERPCGIRPHRDRSHRARPHTRARDLVPREETSRRVRIYGRPTCIRPHRDRSARASRPRTRAPTRERVTSRPAKKPRDGIGCMSARAASARRDRSYGARLRGVAGACTGPSRRAPRGGGPLPSAMAAPPRVSLATPKSRRFARGSHLARTPRRTRLGPFLFRTVVVGVGKLRAPRTYEPGTPSHRA